MQRLQAVLAQRHLQVQLAEHAAAVDAVLEVQAGVAFLAFGGVGDVGERPAVPVPLGVHGVDVVPSAVLRRRPFDPTVWLVTAAQPNGGIAYTRGKAPFAQRSESLLPRLAAPPHQRGDRRTFHFSGGYSVRSSSRISRRSPSSRPIKKPMTSSTSFLRRHEPMPIMSDAIPGGRPSSPSSAPWRSRIALGTSSAISTLSMYMSSSLGEWSG